MISTLRDCYNQSITLDSKIHFDKIGKLRAETYLEVSQTQLCKWKAHQTKTNLLEDTTGTCCGVERASVSWILSGKYLAKHGIGNVTSSDKTHIMREKESVQNLH